MGFSLDESLQNYDERLLGKRLMDTARGAIKGFRCSFTNFLDPAEQDIAELIMENMGELSFRWEGGFPDPERRVLRMAPEEWLLEDEENCLVLLKFSWNSKYSAPISHRDVLGSLMGLGIEREIIGDIKVADCAAYVAVMKIMADFVLLNLNRIGRTPVDAELCHSIEVFQEKYKEVRGTMASRRLDAFLAEAFHLSRGDAQELIRGKKVRLNYRTTENVSAEIDEKDLISVKGYGRARLWELSGKTKKDREGILIRRYL